MKNKLRILIIEDSEDDALLVIHHILKGDHNVFYERVDSAETMKSALKQGNWDIILSDYKMPGFNGLEALSIQKKTGKDIPFIMISGTIGEEVAVEAMKKGAHDYIMKDNLKRLLPAIEREIRESKIRAKKRQLEEKQKEAESQILSEQKLKHLVSAIPVGIMLQNSQGKLVVFNNTALELLDLAPEQIFGKVPLHPDWNAICEEDSSKFHGFDTLFQSVIADKQPKLDLGLGIFRPSKGKRIWLYIDIFPLFDKNGNLIQVLWTFIDRTEQKEVIDALSESEELYRSILLASPDNITITDLEGKIMTISPCALDMFGYENIEELLNRSVMEFIAPSHKKLAISRLNRLINGDKLDPQEYKGLKNDGNLFDIEVNGEIIRSKAGNPIKVVLIVRDITQRKKVETEVTKLTHAIEQSPISIIITNKQGNIEYVNPFFTGITGYNKKETIGKNPRILNSGIIPNETFKQMWETIKSGKIWRGELCNRKKNGEIYWEWASISPLVDAKGQITHFIGIKEDITKRKMIEEELKVKNEELIKLNLEKDKFFSIIAHDLRSPFSTLLGMTELLATKISNISKENLLFFVANIKNTANNLYQLLENLLQWANAQQGLFTFNPKPMNLFETVKESISVLSDTAKDKDIDIAYNISDNFEVIIDLDMFQVIIRNLVSNAVKFTPKGGKINISAKSVENRMIEVSVTDTGIGMDGYILSNLFSLGARINREGTEGEQSSGLGLLLCKDFVEKHDGRIWAKSNEGKGSVFYFTIRNNKSKIRWTQQIKA